MKKTVTLVSLATQMKMDPKTVRAKFRRHPKERPFNHTKVHELNADQVAKAKKFLKQDFRVVA